MRNQDRFKNILAIVTGFLALSQIVDNALLAKVLLQVALWIGIAAILFPLAARWIEWAWLKLALGLGWINSRIILSILYFAFLLPVAWLSRLFTKDPLMLKARNSGSLYVTRDHEYKKEDLENIW